MRVRNHIHPSGHHSNTGSRLHREHDTNDFLDTLC